VYLVGATYPELGGSEYFKLRGTIGGSVPRIRLSTAKRTLRAVTSTIDKGYVKACHDLSEGGLAVAAAEMAFGNELGLDLNIDAVSSAPKMREDVALFSESNSRFLIEAEPRSRARFERLMRGVPRAIVGRIKGDGRFLVRKRDRPLVDVSVEELRSVWKQPFEVK
jgi:phosphoribosylformylglycinamidine synthase